MLSFCCQFTWPHTCLISLLILYKFTVSTSESSVSYSKQCGSVVPEATPTTYADFTFPCLQTLTSFITGGEGILGKDSSHTSVTFLNFYSSRNIYSTNFHEIYKIDAELIFGVDNSIYYSARNSTYGRSYRQPRMPARLKFLLQGYWSESSGKGCFVGSAPWYSSKGEPINLEAVFMINYSKNSTYSNSFVTGKLKSLTHFDDEGYFDSISILSFPQVNWYEYKLISEETVKDIYVFDDIEKSSALGSESGKVCSMFRTSYITLKLEYASSCSSSLKNCSPLDGVLEYIPTYVSLYSIQCHEYGNRMRFLVQLTNTSYVRSDKMFDPSAALVGEGLWDETKNCLVIFACRILSSNSLEDSHVGDCSFRLSLYYPSLWTIKNRDQAVGQIWTNKTAQDVGYFGRIKFRTSDANINVPGFKYEYTVFEKINKLCPKKAVTMGERYPSGQSYDMSFDVSVLNSMYFLWSAVQPVFIGNKSYVHSSVSISHSIWRGNGEIAESEFEFEKVVSDNVPVNVSCKLSFISMRDGKLGAGHSSLNMSLNSYGELVIFAEGVYEAGTGCLCMVGCRNLLSNNLLDCDILINFQLPRSSKTKGGFIKGSMQSTRKQSDPLFFEYLNMSTSSFISSEVQRSVWRIDLEVTMILISNINVCIFVCFQLYHVKRYPNTVPYTSLVMLAILTLGRMAPLLLNYEALFMTKRYTQDTILSSSGWLEVNEVIVRIATTVAFLFQFRLLQLAWTARHKGESNESAISVAEKKTLLVLLPMYIIGGLVAILLSWKKNYYGKALPAIDYSQAQQQQRMLWGDLRSYAGLILDGFLLPQVLLNIFQMSRKRALSMPFYLGTTLIHLTPQPYDLYRANNYVPAHVKGTSVYANPSADFYSAAWDVIIPMGVLLLVVIIFLQQRSGGRVILPRRFRRVENICKSSSG